MSKTYITVSAIFNTYKDIITDIFLFIITVLFGTFIKIYKEPNTNPNKWRFSRLLSEFIVSFLTAFSVYAINDYFLHFPKLIEMMLCVWAGSMSSTIFKEMDSFLSSLFDSFKKFFSNKLQTVFLFLTLSFLLVSCKTQIPVMEKEKTTDKETIQIEKEKTTDRNLAILDSLKVLIPIITTTNKECDSVTNAKINEVLSLINSKKISGQNEYGVYYDKLNKMLVSYANVGETKTQSTHNIYNKDKVFIETKYKEIPIKYIPKWLKILATIGSISIAIQLIALYRKFTKII